VTAPCRGAGHCVSAPSAPYPRLPALGIHRRLVGLRLTGLENLGEFAGVRRAVIVAAAAVGSPLKVAGKNRYFWAATLAFLFRSASINTSARLAAGQTIDFSNAFNPRVPLKPRVPLNQRGGVLICNRQYGHPKIAIN
jgi:hypothetical protein